MVYPFLKNLGYVYCNASFPHPLQDDVQSFVTLLLGGSPDQDIVHVTISSHHNVCQPRFFSQIHFTQKNSICIINDLIHIRVGPTAPTIVPTFPTVMAFHILIWALYRCVCWCFATSVTSFTGLFCLLKVWGLQLFLFFAFELVRLGISDVNHIHSCFLSASFTS